MAKTMKLIAKQTLTGTATSVTFSSIPGTYTDLMLVGSYFNTGTVDNVIMRFNGATNDTNHSGRRIYGTGSSALSDSYSFVLLSATFGSSGPTSAEAYIPNYAGSTAKSISSTGVTENNATLGYIYVGAGLWNNTAAITQITLLHLSGSSFDTGSSFFLYGITKA